MQNILSIYLWIWICVLFATFRGTEFSFWLYCWVGFFSQKEHKLPWHCDKILLLLLLLFFGTGTLCFLPPWKCWSHVSLYSLRTRKEADTTSGNLSNLCCCSCCCCKVARGWKETTEWKLLHSVKYGQGHMYVEHVIRILSVCSYFEHIRL